jgi:hypothetical protein
MIAVDVAIILGAALFLLFVEIWLVFVVNRSGR